MGTTACRECRGTVSDTAPMCPHCGAEEPARAEFRGWGFEWRTRAEFNGVPLIHVAVGRDRNRRLRVAKGWIAIGQFGIGFVTIAQFGVGVIGIGQFVFGFLVLAHVALGSCVGVGQFATGFLFCVAQFGVGDIHLAQTSLQLSGKYGMGPMMVLIAANLVWISHVFRDLYWNRRAEAPPRAPAPQKMAAFLADSVPSAYRPTRLEVLPPGTCVGSYRVADFLGRGGMGSVYRAEHTLIQRTVALKVLAPHLAADTDFVERFKREAQALAELRHPNIVGLYDVGRDGDHFFLAMEFVDGPNLRSVLKSGGLTPVQALHLVPKLCDAMEYAHGRGVIHRDIKPENVLVARDGEPKIADFGLARLVGGPGMLTLTRTDVIMGTPDYMAPEQRESMRDVDHRADIFSLGVVLYEMLTGQLPVGKFDPPTAKVPLDARIDGIVLKALEHERERRYDRAARMGTEIRDVTTPR